MTPAEELRRAAEVRMIVEGPYFREAFAMIEERLIGQLALFETEDARALKLRMLLIALRKVRGYLTNIMQTGRMIEMDELRRPTLAENLISKVRGY